MTFCKPFAIVLQLKQILNWTPLAKFTLAVINTKGRVGDEALSEFLEAGYTPPKCLGCGSWCQPSKPL